MAPNLSMNSSRMTTLPTTGAANWGQTRPQLAPAGPSVVDSSGWTWLWRVRSDDAPILLPLADAHPDAVRTRKMARVEAALFVSPTALPARRLAQVATLADVAEVRQLVDRLNRAYDRAGSSFRVELVASGYRLLTRPQFSYWLGKLHQRPAAAKLSPVAMETLSVIAFRQPLTRADVDAIRGAQSIDVIKQLLDRGLVRIAGEEDTLGKPFLYETTRTFLEMFGLRNLDELPMAATLRRPKSVVKNRRVDATSDPTETEAA